MKLKNIIFLAYQNLQLEFKHTKISWLWLPITFAVLIFAKAFFLGDILKKGEDFIIYLSIGVWVWQYIAMSINAFGSCIYDNKIILNIKIKPISLMYITLFRMFFILSLNTIILFIFFQFYYLPINYLFFLSSLVLFLFGTYQLGKFLSIIPFYVRDITIFINSFLTVVFFLSPIFWYPDQLSEKKQLFLQFNPVYHVLNIFRDSIILGTFNYKSFQILASIAIILFVLNLVFVNKIINRSASKI